MYSLKGSWVGQTFALATPNDSGAKKSRIRRSKEERKNMVESFIKRYQSSNNGNFPSLNLTHKEVGGSFYTVREIVREIIQENRVLGPGQIDSEEQNDTIAVNHPLGTISLEPQGLLIQNAIELNVISSEEENEIAMMNLDTNGQYTKIFDKDDVQNSTQNLEFQTDDGLTSESTSENLVISNHQEQMNVEESLKCNEKSFNENETNNVHLVEYMDTDGTAEKSVKLFAEESELLGAFQAPVTLPTQEVEVETFPLKTIKETVNMSSMPTDSLCSDRDSEDPKFRKFKLSNINQVMDKDKFSSSDTSDVVIIKEANDFESSGSDAHPDMTIKHEAVNNTQINLKDDSVDMPLSPPIKGDNAVLHDCTSRISAHGDTTSRTSELKNIQMQPKNASRTAIYLENSSGTSGKTVKEPTVIHGNDLKKDEKFMAGSSPPLDRIDLESWRATKQENNPLLAFVKACVDAFIRFWSE